MLTEDLHNVEKLLTMPEGKYYDRKAAEYDKTKIANALVAFANADGGTLAIGIKNRKLEGIDHLNPHKINDFEKVGYDLVKPALKVDCEYLPIEVNGKPNRLLLMSVKPKTGVLYSNAKEEYYLRVGDDTKKLTYSEIESMEYNKDIRYYEKNEVSDAILDDLDTEVVEEYKKAYGFTGDNLWKLLFPKGLAKRIVIVDEETQAVKYKLTVAGVLLLAENPSTFIPGARIRFIRYSGREAGVGEHLDVIKQELIEGPLTKQIKRASEVVQSQLREFTNLDMSTGKFETVPEYPDDTWLEGIVNAVAHRAYNLNGDDIRIIMFDDRLVIHSPGGLPSIVTVDNIRTTHYSRNPSIARGLVEFGWVREFGEGVNRMYESMEEFFLDDPEYSTTENSTDLILRNNIVMRNRRKSEAVSDVIDYDWKKLTQNERKVAIYAYEHEEVRPKDLVESVTGFTRSIAQYTLRKLTEKEILIKHSTSDTDPKSFYELKVH